MKPDIKPGDFVIGYHTGIHKVIRFDKVYKAGHSHIGMRVGGYGPDRDNRIRVGDEIAYPQVEYIKVMNEKYDKPHRRSSNSCGRDYCQVIDSAWVDQLEKDYAERIARLRILVAGNWDVANSVKI